MVSLWSFRFCIAESGMTICLFTTPTNQLCQRQLLCFQPTETSSSAVTYEYTKKSIGCMFKMQTFEFYLYRRSIYMYRTYNNHILFIMHSLKTRKIKGSRIRSGILRTPVVLFDETEHAQQNCTHAGSHNCIHRGPAFNVI